MTDVEKQEFRDRGFSEEYIRLRDSIEKHWPQWKIDVYNDCYATSTHARKLHCEST